MAYCFERFINKDRVSLPDIDTDFEKSKRNLVINYVSDKYGINNVSGIGTIGTMKTKKAIQKVTSVLGFPVSEREALSKLILPSIAGKTQNLKTCYEEVPELVAHKGESSTKGKILYWTEKFEGRVVEYGKHAAGIIISDNPVYKNIPLYKTKDDSLATQWNMNECEDAGLIKFDFLGLLTLDKISTTLEFIKERHNVELDINNLPHDDPKTFDMLCQGNLLGMFQMESSSGFQDLITQAMPKNLEDIAALVAIFRPGPLASDGLKHYLNWRGGGEPTYLIPEFENILKETGGFLVYQEQISKIAVECAGYTPGQADILRKGVAKKIPEVLMKEEKRFKEGWINKGLPEDKVHIFWKDLLNFASYCFNKSHAAMYGYITLQTAYLKTHYPIEFLTACMIHDYSNIDQMIKYLGECKRLNFKSITSRYQ
jgi:DNA polymerase-3 subunit alpha